MHFFRTSVSSGVKQLSEQIRQALTENKLVLWLVSGGSNVPITIDVMKTLSGTPLHNLTIMLSDERYGAVGHPDSNAYQLNKSGFDPKEASYLPVLTGQSLEVTADRYNGLLNEQVARHQIIIGQLGIGADGHTSGILPHSPATLVTDKLVTSYVATDFSRITLTFPALKQINLAFVFAFGEAKQPALKRLKDENVAIDDQPAQILKAIPQTYIYNDELEGVVV